jgi:hypothetical protein
VHSLTTQAQGMQAVNIGSFPGQQESQDRNQHTRGERGDAEIAMRESRDNLFQTPLGHC